MNNVLPDFSNGFFRSVACAPLLSPSNDIIKSAVAKGAAPNFFVNDRDSWDLYPVYSLLASAGWNKNTDVFDPRELYLAKNSPRHKPFNLQHNQEQIVGHMYDSMAVDHEYNPIPEESAIDAIPGKLHVITASYLYKYWENQDRQREVAEIINEIANNSGKWFVSMECLFSAFDYILQDSRGYQKVVARNEETNFLTQYLRQYGGIGKYQEYAIGRLLRNITFCAQGLVTKPANPDSIISPNLNLFENFSSVGYITLDQLNEESYMAEVKLIEGAELRQFNIEESPTYKALAAKLEAAERKLAETDKAKFDELNKALAAKDEEISTLKTSQAKSDEDKEKMEEDCAEANAKVSELEGKLTQASADVDSLQKTIDAYKEASRTKARLETLLTKAKLEKAKAEKLVHDFKDLSDVAFAAMVDTICGYSVNAPKQVTTAERAVAAVETLEPSPNLGTVDENKVEQTRADVRTWFTSKAKKGS